MPEEYRWRSIEDLPASASDLLDGELNVLREHWRETAQELSGTDALRNFVVRMHRRWAIETGQIEGVYNLDRGLTETLIDRGIDAALIPHQDGAKTPEHIAAIITDHANVLDGLFAFVKGERRATTPLWSHCFTNYNAER
jgi:hypothetical protein